MKIKSAKNLKLLKIIFSLIILIIMFSFIKNLITQGSNENLSEIINKDAFLVDVRSPQEFAAGSVPGAVNIPLERVEKEISKFRDKKNIVVFCRSGNRSGQAKTILENNGITNVTNGGSWQNVNNYISN
jgi:rhodanese-related sulfurtransferase